MADARGDFDQTVISRQARLRQLICDSDCVEQPDISLGYSELLDALFVLYNECSKDSFKRNKYATGFVKKCESFFAELCKIYCIYD